MTKNKRPELDLDADAQAALDEARDAAGSRANCRDEEGGPSSKGCRFTRNHLCKAGETHENLVAVVDSVWSKGDGCRTLWDP